MVKVELEWCQTEMVPKTATDLSRRGMSHGGKPPFVP